MIQPFLFSEVKLLLARPSRQLDKEIALALGVEGRVEVFEVNAGIREDGLVAQPHQIVGEEQSVHETECSGAARWRQGGFGLVVFRLNRAGWFG
jgi:hypothetical protein